MQQANEPWGLDTRHLAALAAIAETRSISRAAAQLGYGQSAVSQQLAALERVVGQRLVDRGTGPRPVTLTAAGRTLLSHTRWILDRLDTARTELDALAQGTSGTVSVGTFQSAGARLLPRVLASYRKAWPDISVSIHTEGADGELSALVARGALDVAFVEGTSLAPGLASVELLKDRYVALVPPEHRLAGRQTVSLRDLDGEDFVHGVLHDTCGTRAEQALRDAGATARVVFRTGDNTTRQRIVDAGLGCAVLPELTVEPGLPDGGVVVQLSEDVHRVISLAWSAERTPSFALERFVDTAREALGHVGRGPSPAGEAAPGQRHTSYMAT